MKWRILDSSQAAAWNEALSRQPAKDVYFIPQYHRVHELNAEGSAHAFVASDRGQELFYPFMMRPIEAVAGHSLSQTWFDIESVYGYTGPLATTSDQGFLSAAWDCFDSWCRHSHVIAEFVRFNPIIDNFRFVDPSYVVVPRQGDRCGQSELQSEEELWHSYSSRHRNMIRKAEKNGLECAEMPLADGIKPFHEAVFGNDESCWCGRVLLFFRQLFQWTHSMAQRQV